MTIEEALREVCNGVRDDMGRPIKGKLAHLVLNITGDGWQAVAQYWFVKKWNYAFHADPVAAILEALGQPVDMETQVRDFESRAIKVTDFQEQAPAATDLDDLLV